MARLLCLLALTGVSWAPEQTVEPTVLAPTLSDVRYSIPVKSIEPLSGTLYGVPRWVLAGILWTETRSQYREDGTILYRDRKIGLLGEVGAFQIRPITLREVDRLYGLSWTAREVHRDTRAAEMAAACYLGYLHRHHASGDWRRAIRMYCTGPYGAWQGSEAARYLAAVEATRTP